MSLVDEMSTKDVLRIMAAIIYHSDEDVVQSAQVAVMIYDEVDKQWAERTGQTTFGQLKRDREHE
jgi:hypothetical protein